ncbi:MAG: hypothetical protein FJ398_26185 [Verrucomicrobia bacterium]|nr:hypothetical protein [Verrucomicrobiota bacterium]
MRRILDEFEFHRLLAAQIILSQTFRKNDHGAQTIFGELAQGLFALQEEWLDVLARFALIERAPKKARQRRIVFIDDGQLDASEAAAFSGTSESQANQAGDQERHSQMNHPGQRISPCAQQVLGQKQRDHVIPGKRSRRDVGSEMNRSPSPVPSPQWGRGCPQDG